MLQSEVINESEENSPLSLRNASRRQSVPSLPHKRVKNVLSPEWVDIPPFCICHLHHPITLYPCMCLCVLALPRPGHSPLDHEEEEEREEEEDTSAADPEQESETTTERSNTSLSGRSNQVVYVITSTPGEVERNIPGASSQF